MDTSTSMLLTGLVVTGGQIAKGNGISIKIIVAVLFLAMVLSVMGDANSELSKKFGLLILVVAVFAYGPAIIKGTGLADKKKKK